MKQGQVIAYDLPRRPVRIEQPAGTTIQRAGYDGDGVRRIRRDALGTVHYPGWEYERNVGNGQDTTEVITQHYRALGRLIAARRGGSLTWMGTDHLGSTIRTADASFTGLSGTRYAAYGTSRDLSGSQNPAALGTDHTFTSQVMDGATGLQWFNARAYDPSLGRFLQADTEGVHGGDPQTLNRYTYAGNNPARYSDPSGHDDEDTNDDGGGDDTSPDDGESGWSMGSGDRDSTSAGYGYDATVSSPADLSGWTGDGPVGGGAAPAADAPEGGFSGGVSDPGARDSQTYSSDPVGELVMGAEVTRVSDAVRNEFGRAVDTIRGNGGIHGDDPIAVMQAMGDREEAARSIQNTVSLAIPAMATTASAAALLDFGGLVRTNGEWDYKDRLDIVGGQQKGTEAYAALDHYGNVAFGYAAAALGVDPDLAHRAAGFVQQGAGRDAFRDQFTSATFGDRAEDFADIDLGYALYAERQR